MKVYIYISGDSYVGIPSFSTEVDLGAGFDDMDAEEREHVRETLRNAFSDVFCEPVGIEFSDEREAWIKKMDEFFSKEED